MTSHKILTTRVETYSSRTFFSSTPKRIYNAGILAERIVKSVQCASIFFKRVSKKSAMLAPEVNEASKKFYTAKKNAIHSKKNLYTISNFKCIGNWSEVRVQLLKIANQKRKALTFDPIGHSIQAKTL